MGEPTSYAPADLREFLIKHFDLEEMRTLCQDLHIDFDSLRGEGKAAKARELVLLLDRQGRIRELTARLEKARPQPWSEFVKGAPEGWTTRAKKSVPNSFRWSKLGFIFFGIVILGVMIVWIWLSTQNTFAYLVRVQDDSMTKKTISDARVTIEVAGQAPWEAVSDSNGLARILIPNPYSGKPARLLINADGYEPYRQEIDLTPQNLPQTIPLKRLAAQVQPTTSPNRCGGAPEALVSPVGVEHFDRQFGFTRFNTGNSRLLVSNTIRSLLGDESGLWVGYGGRTDEGKSGVSHIGNFAKGSRIWEYCLNALGKPIGQHVNAMTLDKRGALWVATDGAGAWRLEKGQWEQFIFDPNSNNEVPDGSAFAVMSNDENVFVGTLSGITRVNGFVWNRILFDQKVHALAFASNGDTWIGLITEGVRRIRADGDVENYNVANGQLTGDSVRSIVIDQKQRVWVATEDGGLNRFEDGKWTAIRAGDNGFPSDKVFVVALDKYDRVWAGTDKGATYFDGARWTLYSDQDTRAIGFTGHPFQNCSPEETLRDVWTGTNAKGLTFSRLPARSPVITSFKVENIPPTLRPGELFTPTITISLENGYMLTQGDFLQAMDEDSYTSHPLIGLPPGVVVQGGESHTFSFAGNPMRAPDQPNSYTRYWRVWQCGRYVGPAIGIKFTVK